MSQQRIEIERDSRETEILCGAAVGISVVALVQMLGLQSLDVALKVSIYSFAISIPALSTTILCVRDEANFGMRAGRPFLGIFLVIGFITSLIGISGLFFHFATYAGLIFVVASLIGLMFHVRHESRLNSS